MFNSANIGQKGFLVMAALISILLEMPKCDAMSSTEFSIGTTWALGYQNLQRKKLYQSDRGPTSPHPDYHPDFSVLCD